MCVGVALDGSRANKSMVAACVSVFYALNAFYFVLDVRVADSYFLAASCLMRERESEREREREDWCLFEGR